MANEREHGRHETHFYLVSDLFDEFVNLFFDWPRNAGGGWLFLFERLRDAR